MAGVMGMPGLNIAIIPGRKDIGFIGNEPMAAGGRLGLILVILIYD